jgi:hypothetical protein
MLAGMRSRFLVLFVVLFLVAAFSPLQAQVNGVPASVTSIGFGGHLVNGVPPSVTSIGFGGNFGPNGYGSNWSVFGSFLLPADPKRALNSEHHHHRDHDFPVGVLEPAYIPYAAETDDDSAADDSVAASGPGNADPSGKRAGNRDSAPATDTQAEEPVVAQPSTVLVFKDGHQFDVLNYAIVGDTLFDFAAGRTKKILLADLDLPATRKANDDRGVDFEIPVTTRP